MIILISHHLLLNYYRSAGVFLFHLRYTYFLLYLLMTELHGLAPWLAFFGTRALRFRNRIPICGMGKDIWVFIMFVHSFVRMFVVIDKLIYIIMVNMLIILSFFFNYINQCNLIAFLKYNKVKKMH